MSPEERTSLEAFLDTGAARLETLTTAARSISAADYRKAISHGLIPPRTAVADRLVDELIDPASLDRAGTALVPGGRWVGEYWPPAPERQWGERRRIAIVPVLGTITSGPSRSDPFGLTQSAGSDTVARALREASEDPRVAAIVLRVDSGGARGSPRRDRTGRRPGRTKKAGGGRHGDRRLRWVLRRDGAESVGPSPTLTGVSAVSGPRPGWRGCGKKLHVDNDPV
jgi:protease-4